VRLWYQHANKTLVELLVACEGLPVTTVGHMAHDGTKPCVFIDMTREASAAETMRVRTILEDALGLRFVRIE
jgi:succinyl-CoA synthetase beta subunit